MIAQLISSVLLGCFLVCLWGGFRRKRGEDIKLASFQATHWALLVLALALASASAFRVLDPQSSAT